MKQSIINKIIPVFMMILGQLSSTTSNGQETSTKANSLESYFLNVSGAYTLSVNQPLIIQLKQLQVTNDNSMISTDNPATSMSSSQPEWKLNGETKADPTLGTLSPDISFTKATFTAPSTVPTRNPIAVSVSFHPDENSKEIYTLVCNITIVDAQYKISMDGELSSGTNQMHIQLTGVSYASLQHYADGTYALKPADGSNSMDITVLDDKLPGFTFVGPLKYKIPYVINLGNLSKTSSVPAKISIVTFSPTDTKTGKPIPEQYIIPGVGKKELPNSINEMFSGAFVDIFLKTTKENGEQSAANMAFIERLRDHENDPGYLKTQQGKSDMAQMQKFMQEQGYGDVYSKTKQAPAKTSDYSKTFVQGMKNTQNNPSPVSTAPGVYGGSYHFDGTFNNKSSTCLEIRQENHPDDAILGLVTIKIEKLK